MFRGSEAARWRARLYFILFFLAVATAFLASLLIDWPGSSNLKVQVGDISTVDVRAPRPVTYQSEALTEQARAKAAASVPKVYDPPQTRIARQQLARAEQVLTFMDLVRMDPYASEEQKLAWLSNISDFKLDEATARLILSAPEESWGVIATETVRVLDLAMRSVIREGELENAQRRVPSLIGFGLSDDEAAVVTTLVQGLLRPNTFFNAERTEAAREEAAAAVEPVERTIAAGEIIVRSGDRIDELDMEALNALGLLSTKRTWEDYVSSALLAALLTGVLMAYITYTWRQFWASKMHVLLLGIIVIGFIVLAKLMVPTHTILPYLYPLAAMAMLIGALIDVSIATVATLTIGALLAVFTGGETEIVLYGVMSALAGALALGQAERLNSFARASVWVIVVNLAVLAIFRLPLLEVGDQNGLSQLAIAALVNGIFASSFTLVVFYLLGQLFGLTTSLQLLELSRPTHPLLRELLLKAPGTYYHTLLVSNMAEEAADAIGADSLLTRVGSYYHDIGKVVRPYFFIENNRDGVNPHDRLDPYTSARIIISHVTDGVDLAHKYKLPTAIVDFIREHHGTTRVEYFYHKACQESENLSEVDESAFRYPGPKPRSRESAILMLADGCEATVRATNPATVEDMKEVIDSVINRRLLSGQLSDSPLTLRDLSKISESFLRVLQSIHHPRIQYPSGVTAPTTQAASHLPAAQPAPSA
ncbi:MAG: HDIG domain-containing protein [Chloroflexi bacterium]|nr:HDIG domain-containing protein [Chloroflexota bacterium]